MSPSKGGRRDMRNARRHCDVFRLKGGDLNIHSTAVGAPLATGSEGGHEIATDLVQKPIGYGNMLKQRTRAVQTNIQQVIGFVQQ